MKLTLDNVQKTIDTAELLFENGTPTFQRIYQLCLTEPKMKAATYYDESGNWVSYDYAQYKEYAEKYARHLCGLLKGYPQGAVVGLKMKNSHIWPYLFWGILASGHIPLLLDYRLEKEKTEVLLDESGAVALLASEVNQYGVPLYGNPEILMAEQIEPSIWEDKIILCTSGTTGASRMMVYRGKNMAHQILSSKNMPKETLDIVGPQKINILAMIPLHHIFGLVAVFLWYSFYHKNIVYPASTSSKDILSAIRQGKCTHVYSVPMLFDSLSTLVGRTMAKKSKRIYSWYQKMVAYNCGEISKKEAGFGGTRFFNNLVKKQVLGKSPVYLISGGGYLKESTNRTVNGLGYPLYNGIGMTEVGVTSVELSPDPKERLKGSVGHALYGVEYKVDSNGELLIKSPVIHEEEIIGGKKRPTPLEDGYFRSGDLVEMDDKGKVYVKGRLKEVIINSNGENVYPDELEAHFKELPHLVRLSIMGVKKKDGNEEIALVGEPEPGLDNEKTAELKKAFEEQNDLLGSTRRVERFYLATKPLPLANGIKIKRLEVARNIAKGEGDFIDLYEENRGQQSFHESLASYDPNEVRDILGKIKKAFASTLLLNEVSIRDDSDFGNDLGGDSMSYVSMVFDLNEALGIELPEEQYGKLLTPTDFALFVLRLRHPEQ